MRGGLCYSRVDAGVSGPDKRRGHAVFTVGSFMAPVKQEPVVEVGVAGGLRWDDHCLCSARPPL